MSAYDAFAPLVARCGIEATERMRAHWRLVCAWQATTNLTGIKNDEEAVTMHYEDALEALPLWPEGTSLCDVGSGAGFPGLVLAAMRPQSDVLLLEPRRLRLAFLREAAAALELPRVRVVPGTLGAATPLRVGCMTMRAVFSQDEQLDACAKHLTPDGRLLVFRQGEAHAQTRPRRFTRVRRHTYRLRAHALVRSVEEWRLQRREDTLG